MEIHTPNTVVPGTSLPVEIKVTADEEIQTKQVSIELVGEETYYMTEARFDSEGKSDIVNQHKNKFFAATQVLAAPPNLTKGIEQKRNRKTKE